VSAAALLTELEEAGIHVTREGDSLRVRGEPGVRLTPYTEPIREQKPALLAALHEREASAQHDAQTKAARLTPGEAAALGLDPTLAWTHADRGPVAATRPPAGWRGVLCDGCRWPKLCGVLGPRGPHLPGGPCTAWPGVDQQPHG
jgi:hypothetical protein